MGASKLSPDILQPCGGRTGKGFLGGCFQDFIPKDVVKIIRNVTQVEDYQNPGQYIDPYPVANQGVNSADCSPYDAGGCPDNPCYKCGDFGMTNNNLPCWPLDPSHYHSCGGGTSSFAILDYHNCFATSSVTESLTNCREIGFKKVIAAKIWPGAIPNNDRTFNQTADALQWCCQCGYHNFNIESTPNTIKYLALAGSANTHIATSIYDITDTPEADICCPFTGNPDGGPIPPNCFTTPDGLLCCTAFCHSAVLNHTFTATANATAATHLDKFGNSYSDYCTSGSSNSDGNPDYDAANADTAFALLGGATSTIATIGAEFCAQVESATSAFGQPEVIDQSGPNVIHVEWHTTLQCADDCGNPTSTNDVLAIVLDLNLAAGTLDFYTYGPKLPKSFCDSDGYCPAWIQTSHTHWAYTGANFNYSLDATGIGSISIDSQYHEDVAGSYSSPYTSQNQRDDCEAALKQWNMDDDALMPWRTGASGVAGVTNGVLVTYDEGNFNSGPNIPQCSSSILYTGKIRGEPGPVGVDRIWDPYHKNWCVCDSLVQPGCSQFYIQTYGQWSTQIGVPSATQWGDEELTSQLPDGAFVSSNRLFTIPLSACNSNGSSRIVDDTLWMAKMAWIIFPKQSYNLARPCGPDRWRISASAEQNGHCVSSVTGHTLNLEPTGPPTDIVPGDVVWYIEQGDTFGVPAPDSGSLDGAWNVQSVGGGGFSVTLQEPRIASASQSPIQPIQKVFTGIVAKCAWQNDEAPGVCGRVDIVGASNNMPVTLSLADETYLATGDQVTVVNSIGNNINGNWTVTVSASNVIMLNGSDGTHATVYTGSGQLYVQGAADWKWNSTDARNFFKRIEWQYNYRDIGNWYNLANQSSSLLQQFDCVTSGQPDTPCPNPDIGDKPRKHLQPCGYDENVNFITCSTHCLPFSSCRGVVAGFWPANGPENFGNSPTVTQAINLGWAPATVLTDNPFGSNWQGLVRQSMDDPLNLFYQVPPCPCEPVDDGVDPIFYACDFEWFEDDGTCEGDGIDPLSGFEEKFYPLTDQFEPFCRLSDISAQAPDFPDGVNIDCAKISDFTSDTDCPSNVCVAPFTDPTAVYDTLGCGVTSTIPFETSWATYLNRLSCVCLNGQFKAYYENNGIICPSDFFINLPL